MHTRNHPLPVSSTPMVLGSGGFYYRSRRKVRREPGSNRIATINGLRSKRIDTRDGLIPE